MAWCQGWWERRRDSDDSDHSANGRTKRAQKAEAELVAKRPRQVAGLRIGIYQSVTFSGNQQKRLRNCLMSTSETPLVP